MGMFEVFNSVWYNACSPSITPTQMLLYTDISKHGRHSHNILTTSSPPHPSFPWGAAVLAVSADRGGIWVRRFQPIISLSAFLGIMIM